MIILCLIKSNGKYMKTFLISVEGGNVRKSIFHFIFYICINELLSRAYCRSPYNYDRSFHIEEIDIKDLNYGYTNFDTF